MSLSEKIDLLPRSAVVYVENIRKTPGYMGIKNNPGENKIEYQKIGPKVSGGSFIRLSTDVGGNSFFGSLLMCIRNKVMSELTAESKIEFTRLFREWYMTPKRIAKLKERANSLIKSTNMSVQVEDAFKDVEQNMVFTDMLVATLITQDVGYSAIFLNSTNDEPWVPRIPSEQCLYNIQNNNPIILFLYYGTHYEPIFFLSDRRVKQDEYETRMVFKDTSDELKPILQMLDTACASPEAKTQEELNTEAAIQASLVSGGGAKTQEELNIEQALQASLASASASASASAPALQGQGAAAAEGEGEGEAEAVQEIEQIVAAFVAKHAETWKTKRPTFLHKSAKHTTTSRPLEDSLKNPLIPMDNFLVKTCRGTNNDCIINSLLTCLSPTFRRLEGEFKDKVASYYRYEKLLPMYNAFVKSTRFSDQKSKAKAESIVSEIASGIDKYKIDKKKVTTTGYGGRPISAEVAAAFGITHGISVLIKESEAREQGAFTLLGPQPAAPRFIIIHNMDGVHYSSISDSSDNYVFNTTMLQNWIGELERRQHTENVTKCKFITGQVLRHDGNLYIVVNAENTDDGQGCKHIYIHTLGCDVDGYKQDIQNILLIKKVLFPPTFGDPGKPGYNHELDVALHVEWQGNLAGAQRALATLKTRYPIFQKKYKTYNEVYADATTLPFIDIKGKPGYELANPAVHDKDGVPSTYLEFMASASGVKEVEGCAAKGGGGSTRKTRKLRKTRKGN